ncbi:pyridoxal phosphate-dependent class II aminotransferase [Halomonas salifodinae]|uniref:threonine-phosphate decarboxylase CobD n=1 Tax=Halomonas salifodinae TaxID=438745 RepID=UPI0031F9CAFE
MRPGDTPSNDWPLHGGEAAPLLARFGLPSETPLRDVSANLNPLGPPAWLPEWLAERAADLGRYPDPDYAAARAAIAAREGVAAERVRLTNGGAEAIYLAAALHAGRPAAIVEPGFAEYRRACAAYGLPVHGLPLAAPDFALDFALGPEALVAGLGEAEVLFMGRPNNPTATLVPRPVMERLLELTAERGCTLVVDEAFIDFVDDAERLTPWLERFEHLVLLRSLTKWFTLPGLRLGYLLAAPARVAAAAVHQPAWSVNQLAADLVAPLLADRDFNERTRAWLAAERPAMQAALTALGLRVVPSRANFFLVRHPEGAEATARLLPALLRRGWLARHTQGFAGLDGGWLRLALRTAEENRALCQALAEAMAEVSRGGTP